jgi:hypothetical protein
VVAKIHTILLFPTGPSGDGKFWFRIPGNWEI